MRTRRSLLHPLLIIATLVLALGAPFFSLRTTFAQATPIDCASYVTPTPAGSPAATTAAPEPASSPEAVAFPEAGGNVTVFAAASLTDSFTTIGEAITAQNPNVTFTFNFAGSQALVTQLTEGNPADVFASANNTQMKAAQEAGVIDGDSVVFTQNRLALIVPKDNPAGIASFADLSKDGVKLVVAAADVPVGNYGRQAVCKAGADTATYGDGFVEAVQSNIVSEEDNVKAVASKVALGEADAGIVYTTDVTEDIKADVVVIEIPAEVNIVAKYPIAPVAGGNADLAAAFIAFVNGPEGQAILQKYGFEPKP